MRKSDYLPIAVLMLVPFLIFYSLFSAEYLYTDEAVQLWFYRKGSDYQMFASQGRYITEKLFQWLFSSIDTIREVKYLRLFSFFGWVLSIPIWFGVLKSVIKREGLPEILAFFSVLYMIAMPPFSVYVSWASCIELFLANTSGLLSGYFLYSATNVKDNKVSISWKRVLQGVLFGIVSLFTYQTGFGSFLLPFLLHLLSAKKVDRLFWIGIGGCLAIYAFYFLLFKMSVVARLVQESGRTSVSIDPLRKLFFMLTRPLASAFHFTFLVNERSIAGIVVSLLFGFGWFIYNWYLLRVKPLAGKLLYFGALFLLLLCIYIPGLIVKENYASNRTLFALNMAVFFLVIDSLLSLIQTRKARLAMVCILSTFFLVNAWYNFNVLFLAPIKTEYKKLRAYVEANYDPSVQTVHFIRPEEDFFVRKYRITRSWDEFGVPSTFFNWVPEFWIKQVVLEHTGSRTVSDRLVIKHWLGKKTYEHSGEPVKEGVLLVDVEQILSP